MKTDVTSIIGFAGPTGRALLGVYAVITAVLAVMNLGGEIVPALSIVSIVVMCGGLFVLGLPGGEPFPMRYTLLVLLAVFAIAALSAWNLVDVVDPRYAAWYIGADVFLLFVLALRGRRAIAWFAYLALAIVLLVAALTTDAPLIDAANTVIRQAGTLFIGTMFAILLRRAARSIAAIDSTRLSRTTRDAATAVAVRERAVQNARLERDARPALQRLTQPHPLSEQELAAITLLDESLRDGLIAAGFSGDQLADEIRFARQRGIRVVLVDDRGEDLPPVQRERVETALISEIRLVRFGTVTARLSPVDRPEIASIITDDGGRYRSVTVTADAVEIVRI